MDFILGKKKRVRSGRRSNCFRSGQLGLTLDLIQTWEMRGLCHPSLESCMLAPSLSVCVGVCVQCKLLGLEGPQHPWGTAAAYTINPPDVTMENLPH